MNCYYHPEKSAVALCKSCGRGLCMDCAADIQNGLACKGRCEERVARINKMIDNNPQIVASANAQIVNQRIALILIGLALVGIGIFLGMNGSIPGYLFIVAGAVFLIRAFAARRYPGADK